MKSSLPIKNIFQHFFFNICNLFNNALVSRGDTRNIIMSLRNTFNFRLLFFDKSEQIYAKLVSPSN